MIYGFFVLLPSCKDHSKSQHVSIVSKHRGLTQHSGRALGCRDSQGFRQGLPEHCGLAMGQLWATARGPGEKQGGHCWLLPPWASALARVTG
jgi:hypothetical protein